MFMSKIAFHEDKQVNSDDAAIAHGKMLFYVDMTVRADRPFEPVFRWFREPPGPIAPLL